MKYLIWSVKHGQWWEPDHCGWYTNDINKAGEYTAKEADEIELHSQCAGRYDQISVRIPLDRILAKVTL